MRIKTHGGLSILNGIPLGLGSSCAIDLEVETEASHGKMTTDSRLVQKILEYFKEKTGKDFSLSIESQIPQAGGLKSSSAVACGAIAAIASLEKLDLDVPLLAAQLSLESGVSVTGALDDAVAAYNGGVSVCDNSKMKVLRRARLGEGITFVVLPRGDRKNFDPDRLTRSWPTFKAISGMVMMGDYLGAMARNGLTVSEVLGYETEVLLRAMDMGAKAAGVSGNGPSLFAAVREGDEGPFMDLFSGLGQPVIAGPV